LLNLEQQSNQQESEELNKYSSDLQSSAATSEFRGRWSSAIPIWARPFTHLHRIPVFKRVFLYLVILAVYTIAVNWFGNSRYQSRLLQDAGAAGACASIVLGLLLVFRTNSAYERWSEGRKLWGDLASSLRNICLKIQSFGSASQTEKQEFGELLISYAYALKHHLRNTKPAQPLPGVGVVDDDEHLPLHIAGLINQRIASWLAEGKLDSHIFEMIDPRVNALVDVCSSCERIKNTPIALSYRAFMRHGISLNLLAWPWYVVHQSIWWTLPPILIGGYFLVGIELIAEDIEEPFGRDEDDLPLDSLCSDIKKVVGRILDLAAHQKFTTSIEKPRLDLLKDQLRL